MKGKREFAMPRSITFSYGDVCHLNPDYSRRTVSATLKKAIAAGVILKPRHGWYTHSVLHNDSYWNKEQEGILDKFLKWIGL